MILAYPCQLRHRGGEGLFHRRVTRQRAVTALVKRRTGRIEKDADAVFEDTELDLVHAAVLFQPCGMIPLFELFDDRFLDDLLTRGDRRQRRVKAVSLDGKSVALTDEAAPIRRFDALEQRVKVARLELSHQDEHPRT